MRISLFAVYLGLIFCSCSGDVKKDEQKTANNNQPITAEKQILNNIDSLKSVVNDGDLITRMNDNIISYQAKLLNQTDKSFSHAGVIITKNNVKMVCDIVPGNNGGDTVRFEPIDSFINPKYNLLCGLFRYDLSDSERISFTEALNNYHNKKIHFDSLYDLHTDNKLYCSEMIMKSLSSATHNRFNFKTYNAQPKMLPLLYKFFDKQLTKKMVQQRKFLAIDNLYVIPQCKELMRFTLRNFNGQ